MNKKVFVLNFTIRVLIINITGLILLWDSISFNQGLISLQSLIYCLSSLSLYIFIFIETSFVYLQYYGLDLEFINLVLLNLKNLDYNFVKIIILDKSNYMIYFIVNLIILIYLNKISNFILINQKFIIDQKFRIFLLGLILFIIILFLPFETNNKIRDKIMNFEKTVSQYSLFRNDNWFISLKSQIVYRENITNETVSDLDDFSEIIDFNKYNNIFIIINESYPTFKNQILKEKLFNLIIDNNNNNFYINNFKKSWSKKYSTQGAELNLFCGDGKNFIDFQNKSLGNFIKENDCYFNNFKSINKVFIHSHNLRSFGRNRYSDFFDEIIGSEKLKSLKLDECNGSYTSYCDHQVLHYIRSYEKKDKNMIIFLTVNNHIPTRLISKVDVLRCEDHHPLNILEQMCFSFHNQGIFNKALSKFLNTLKKGELLIFYSDTPPIFPARERVHFEDLIDVYTFEKK